MNLYAQTSTPRNGQGNNEHQNTRPEKKNHNEISKNVLSICLINARSLMPKLHSLYETMQELKTDVCVVTETWMREDPEINQHLEDFTNLTGYSILRKDRENRRGGGVAILFNNETISLTSVKTKRTDYEILAALGRRTGQRRKLLVIAVYVPPDYDSDQSSQCLSEVNDMILSLRKRYNNPYVVVGGDWNKREARNAVLSLIHI